MIGKAFYGRVDGSNWAIQIAGIDNAFLLKPLGQRSEWHRVNEWKGAARREWIRTKRGGNTTTLLRRWIREANVREFFVKYEEGDDSVEVFYTAKVLAGATCPA